MSFLTPFYVLGALAIAGPIVFHLIRRSPRGEVPFSSLMFLAPTPPRLTRRSRLDDLLLLMLRAVALGLLALAFARPFLRETARLDSGDAEASRVAVVVDTSASMRRGDLWPRAKALALGAIGDCRPGDELAVFAFDRTTRTLLGFDESAGLDPARRRAVAEARVNGLEPTWESTDLGQALVDAVTAVEDVAEVGEASGRMPRRVVLVGDLQQGSRVEALGGFEWPADVELVLRAVDDGRGNAGLHRLDDAEATGPAEAGGALRVRVTNDPAARREAFKLTWVDDRGKALGDAVEAYVPPGEGRVVRVQRPEAATALRLDGDAHPFDNLLHAAPDRRDEATVLFVGDDAPDDPAGLLYYLRRVYEGAPGRPVRVVARSPTAPPALDAARPPALIVLASETTAENVSRLKTYLDDGGTVLGVIARPGRLGALAALAGLPGLEAPEAAGGRDVMLGEVAFDHPLFAPLAGPQFNDFTKIHFWKYRRVDPGALGDARVIARFEGGDPAFVEKGAGKGRLFVLTTGWAPADGQLARSSKFVPLMLGLLEGREARPLDRSDYRVGDRVETPAGSRPAAVEADRPGLYRVETPQGPRSFAVNLDPAESRTAPLAVETLEQLGCRMASTEARKAADLASLRQLHNAELEGRQKLWRWLIVAALVALIVETWLAGRLRRPRPARAEALAT